MEGESAHMRRYELMLVLRPDVADDKSQALIDRTTRGIVAAGGQIVKVAPWGRRRLAYPIDRHREGSYHIILFEAPSDSIVELEHTLLITEEVLRHLVTRVERPAKSTRGDGSELDELDDTDLPSGRIALVGRSWRTMRWRRTSSVMRRVRSSSAIVPAAPSKTTMWYEPSRWGPIGYASRRRPQGATLMICPPSAVIWRVVRSTIAAMRSSGASGRSTSMSSYRRMGRQLLPVGMPRCLVDAEPKGRRGV